MIDFKLTQLRYFCEVCRVGNVTKAAENLNIAQPSVSAAIKNLEKSYGIILFLREGNRLKLTQEGEMIFEDAAKLLEHAEDVDSKMRKLSKNDSVIRIGVSPMISVFLFLPILNQFNQRHPDITLEMHEYGSIDSKRKVLNNELDMAIVIGGDQDEKRENWMPLLNTHLMLCTSKKHRLTNRKYVTIEDLKDERLIMMKATSYQIGALVNSRFEESKIKPNIMLYSNQLSLINEYIHTYGACAFLMKDYVDACMKDDPDIQSISIRPKIDIPIGLLQAPGKSPSQHASVFLSFLSEKFSH